MLRIVTADRAAPLAAELARVLAEPLDDPFTPDWVAVPTEGMRRWLQLELATSLGASGPGGDGIAANIELRFPGALRHRVLEAGLPPGTTDPWRVEHLVWAVLEVLRAHTGSDGLGTATTLPQGATWYGRARRLADLFDRYAVHRPDLIRHWAAGRDVDGTGRALPPHHAWQPRLWRLVRSAIGAPSPPERLPTLLDAVRAGTVEPDLPPRLALFGLTTLPGGAPFLDVADAVAARRDVHLLLLDPAPAATTRVQAGLPRPDANEVPLRADDTSGDAVHHPLVRSWARPVRETSVLLADRPRSEADPAAADPAPTTLLARVQADLRADRAPAGDTVPDVDDDSIRIHACHGQARQVEVARDAILHLLADDPTLAEDDVVVLCPAIDEYAPLVEAVFGPSADDPDRPAAVTGPPRLAYRIADRSLVDTSPVFAALATLLDVLGGRFTASGILELVSSPPVRDRFGLDDDSLGTIADWVGATNVRWGLDPDHRAGWGVPAEVDGNTWRHALDRILMGVAVGDHPVALATGGIAPLDVEGDRVRIAGALADLLARLEALTDDVHRPRPAAAWCDTLTEASRELFAVAPRQAWQLERLHRLLAEIGDDARVGADPATVDLTLADVRRLLAERLALAPRRPDFFRGGVTVSSLTPLRWVPFRVVVVLGLDEVGGAGGAPDGDDLAAAAPHLGDRDARADARQALLEAVLAASDHLVITHTGHNVRTNQPVPPSVALAELRDAVVATVHPDHRQEVARRLVVEHPRQPFDERNFTDGGTGRPGPWGFDPSGLAGARARRHRARTVPPFLAEPLPAEPGSVIDLADLHAFLRRPVQTFLTTRLGIRLPAERESTISDDLPVGLGGLDRWAVGTRLVDARRAGYSTEQWARAEAARGALPPGRLGDAERDKLVEEIDLLLACAREVDLLLDRRVRPDPVDVDVLLGDGTRVVGRVALGAGPPRPGPGRVLFNRPKPEHVLRAWLDLLAVTAAAPEVAWHSAVVRRGPYGKDPEAIDLEVRAADPDQRRRLAMDGLAVAVDCLRRGRREPLPLFPRLSERLHAGAAQSTDWHNSQPNSGGGDGDAPEHRLVHGDLRLPELLELPVQADDPPGTAAGRVQRFADHLWGAVERTCVDLRREEEAR